MRSGGAARFRGKLGALTRLFINASLKFEKYLNSRGRGAAKCRLRFHYGQFVFWRKFPLWPLSWFHWSKPELCAQVCIHSGSYGFQWSTVPLHLLLSLSLSPSQLAKADSRMLTAWFCLRFLFKGGFYFLSIVANSLFVCGIHWALFIYVLCVEKILKFLQLNMLLLQQFYDFLSVCDGQWIFFIGIYISIS